MVTFRLGKESGFILQEMESRCRGFKWTGDLVGRSTGCCVNGLEAEARMEGGELVRSALPWPGGR